MKWHSTSYLENRLFDSRLVKDNLLDQYNPDGDSYPQRRDYRQFLETYPWSSTSFPGDLEYGAEAPIPPKIGASHQITKPYPWRPTLAYEMTEVQPYFEQPISRQYTKPCYQPKGMSVEPITFPNLVTGYEKHPQHAARVALYTRYTPGEWVDNCLSRFSESNVNRNLSERLRNESIRVMREADERTSQGQRDCGRRLGERLTDVTFWRNELNTAHEKLVTEIATLMDIKRNVAKAIQDLEAPLHIAKECLYNRESRQDVEKVHDNVEKSILREIDNIKNCENKLRDIYDQITRQLADCRAAQHALEDDVDHKESTIGIDSICHQLNNCSRGINYYGGIEKYDPTISSIESWARASSARINKAMVEKNKSTQLRSDAETLINSVSTSVWDHWTHTNNSLDRRSSEIAEAKSKIQLHLHKVQQEIFDLEKNINLLRKAIDDKSKPLKVAQTRLEARSHRRDLELCKDFAQLRLVQEVQDIQDSVANLHYKLQEAEQQHQQLLKTKSNLEADLKRKMHALFIDREKCMGIRRSFPVSNMIKY